MGNTTSVTDPDYGLALDSELSQQQQAFVEFYDDLQAQFGDDLSEAFTCPIPDTLDSNQIPNLDEKSEICQAAIQWEPRLADIRYRLVPGRISESHFWTQFLLRYEEFTSRYHADLAPNQVESQLAAPTPISTVKTQSVSKDKREMLVSAVAKTEISLLTIPEVFVYQIPARRDAQGHYAQSWKLENPLWSGALRVLSSDDYCIFLRLYDPRTGNVFANSDIIDLQQICRKSEPNRMARLKAIQLCIEPTLDTSRYFVVRFLNTISNQVAYLGIGFRHRSSAFDFNASIIDQLSKCERYLNLHESRTDDQRPVRDRNMNISSKDGNGTCNQADDSTSIKQSSSLALPDLPILDSNLVPPLLSPPKTQPFYRETDDEDEDSFGSFLSAGQ